MTSVMQAGIIPTTANEWIAIRDKIESTARSPYTAKDMRVLWCQGIIVCLSGVLYLATLLRRASENGLWCFRRDVDGYWRPNVHVAIPVVTIVYAAAQSTAIGLILLSPPSDAKNECIVALNLAASSTLYLGGWTKTWAVLYALPSSIFRFRRRDVLGSTARITRRRVFPPRVFNWVILAGYLAGLLPLPWLFFTVYWVHKIHQRLAVFDVIVEKLIAHLSATPQDLGTSLSLAVQTGGELLDLQDTQNQTLNNLRIFAGFWFLVSFTALVIFLSASFALLLAFTRQIEILSKIQREREQLIASRASVISVVVPTTESTVDTPDWRKGHQMNQSKPSSRLFHRISVWLPSLSTEEDDDPLDKQTSYTRPPFERRPSSNCQKMWLAGVDGKSRPKVMASDAERLEGGRYGDESARKHRKRMVEYCVRYTWQTIFCLLIATSYIVLNIFIVCNVLDAPRSISLSQLFRTIEQWAAWSWGGGPGAILGLLACVVAFSRPPALPREPEQGPPGTSKPVSHGENFGDDEEEDKIGALPDANALTFEKLQAHSMSESSGNSRKLKNKSSKSGAGLSSRSWRVPFPKIERSHFSVTSKSKDTSATSDFSTTASQGWSPYKVSLNTATLITRSPVRQFAVSDIYHSQNSEEQITPPPKAAYSCPMPQLNNPVRTKVEPPIKLYPLPVRVPRSEGPEDYSMPSSPLYQNSTSENLNQGHFNAIHRLRER
ncbi:hypothetical protein CROQUDRAFT_65581 [Cronartium quercuum f. sp. fusiforme G11]|uniref:Uncharacterized protein n=1 Tax=Cronartium quercuum f. sp. fusiforme G11 TaxID=708437 RepID=A0A9P6T9V6_9BASI|nr:hypothetical protein CROQUDRAFT_65581 [Cronartium quercuum f. sp. fusiforme G11]